MKYQRLKSRLIVSYYKKIQYKESLVLEIVKVNEYLDIPEGTVKSDSIVLKSGFWLSLHHLR